MRIIKNAHKVCVMIYANYLIAKDALLRASANDDTFTSDMWKEATDHLTQNAIDAISEVGGLKELEVFDGRLPIFLPGHKEL